MPHALVQAEFTQICCAPHALKQPLQFKLSFVVFAQYGTPASGEHSDVPPPHVVPHLPPEHTWPEPHGFPQPPQLLLSVSVDAQNAPPSVTQSVWPAPHADVHLPFTQSEPTPQYAPHVPQLFGSTLSSTQLSPHCVEPPPHDVPHFPCEQSCPAPHARPHEPQLRLSWEGSLHAPLQMTWPAVHTVASGKPPDSSSEHADTVLPSTSSTIDTRTQPTTPGRFLVDAKMGIILAVRQGLREFHFCGARALRGP